MKERNYAEILQKMNADRGYENYQNGIDFEFRVLRKQKRNSEVAIRSAGSHSLIDIVSIRKDKILLISCKKNAIWTSRELNSLKELSKKIPANCIIKLAYYISKKKWKITDL